MNNKDIYYGDCHHIFCDDIKSDDCIHRYFEYHLPEGDYGRVIVCNEYLRLKVNEYRHRNDGLYYYMHHFYTDVIENIFSELFPVKYTRRPITKLNPSVTYSICHRPYIFRRIDLFTAIEKYYNLSAGREIKDRMHDKITEVSNYLLKYTKYKKYHERVRVLLNKIQPYNYDTQLGLYITELSSLLFEMQSKFK